MTSRPSTSAHSSPHLASHASPHTASADEPAAVAPPAACDADSPAVPADDLADEYSAEMLDRTAEVFRALAASSRLRILLVLTRGEASVSGIVDETGLSQPLVSQHLKLLRSLRLVEVRRSGREAIYSFKDDHVSHILLDALDHSAEHQDG